MSEIGEQVRWGILGTAGIAESSFLPALRETGDGVAVSVGSRDLDRARVWADEQSVERGVLGYETVIADPDVEAVYIPLPNGLHADWTIAALEAGKTVFCEKPLCGTVEETERVLAAARSAPVPCGRRSSSRSTSRWIAPANCSPPVRSGTCARSTRGSISSWTTRRTSGSSPTWRGARSRTSAATRSAWRACCSTPSRIYRGIADAEWTPDGADTELWGALVFPGDRRLVFSCGFRSGYDTLTRILGTEGEIRMTGPFHPDGDDEMLVIRDGRTERQRRRPPVRCRSRRPSGTSIGSSAGWRSRVTWRWTKRWGTRGRSPRCSTRPGRARSCAERSAPGGSRTPNLLIRRYPAGCGVLGGKTAGRS